MPTASSSKGMTRRASASSPQSPNASLSRVHRSNDSQYGFVGTHPTHSGWSSYTASGSTGSPQDKVVLALIKRLMSKLPCYSGLSLSEVESDSAVQLTIQSLADLARHALDIIVWKLCEELEKLERQTDVNGHRTVDVLQSQLFLLKVMSVTMASRWQSHKLEEKRPQSGTEYQFAGPSNGTSASLSASSQRKSNHTNPQTRNRPGFVSSEYLPSAPGLEAPPLDENCAKWLVSVVVPLMRQSTPHDERPKWNLNFEATLYGFESIELDEGWAYEEELSPSSSEQPSTLHSSPLPHLLHHPSSTSIASTASSSIPLPRSSVKFKPTARTLTSASLSLHDLIGKWAGNIVYLLSASNWNVVFLRIRTKIHQLARAGSADDTLDSADLQLIQHCAMDRVRLLHLLQDLSSLLVNMQRDAQGAVALALRKAIWNWIDIFPQEYHEVITGKSRLDSAPERVFDLFYQMSEVGDKSAIWPALVVLMTISHERMKHMALASRTMGVKPNKKEVQFVEQVVKTMHSGSRLADISLVCCIDICRAAARTRPDGDPVLRAIAPEVSDEIKSRLWKSSGQKSFYESPDQIDVALYADAIVAMYRFLPEEESMQIFHTCLEPERSDAVKMCAVKACVILAQEASRWPWQPSLEPLLHRIGPRLRSVFRSAVLRRNEMDENGNIKRAMPRPNAKRFTSETIPDRELLVLAILSLYRIDARFFLTQCIGPDLAGWVTDTVQVLQRPGDPAVPLSSVRTFMQAAMWILELKPGDDHYEEGSEWMGKAIPASLLSSCSRLLDSREDFEEQRMCVTMAHGILLLYAAHSENVSWTSWQLTPERVPAMAVAELAFLVSLTSADNGVSTLAAKGLRAIAMVERVPNAPSNPGLLKDEREKRYPVYEQLGDPKVMAVGRVGHQKRVRKLLRGMAAPTPMHVAVWLECFWRWSGLEESVIRRSSLDGVPADGSLNGHRPVGDRSMSPEERLYQWQNLTLFLAAFGAACATNQTQNQTLTSIIPASCLPDRFRVLQDSEEIIKNFITSAVDFLVADSLHARETAKEALGTELTSSLYGKLFQRLNDVIEEITKATEETDSTPGNDELFLVFFEQFVAVLKLVIDRIDPPSEYVVWSIDLNQTLLTLANFVDHFSTSSSSRLKIKFCGFCDSALARSDSFGPRKDDKMRNSLLEAIAKWIQVPIASTSDEDDILVRTQYDTNVASIKTIVTLLEHLNFQSVGSGSTDDASHAVSRRFSQYQRLLMSALIFNRPGNQPEEDETSALSSYSHRKTLSEREFEMRELVINGLANMLSANTDVGFKPCLRLAYDDDPGKRAMFCHVVARVVGSGATFEGTNHASNVLRRSDLCDLVKGSDMILAVTICEACPASETEMLIPVMLNLFDSRASLMALLKLVIEREVKNAQSEVALFRGNSMRTLLLCGFAKLHGYDYLRTVLKPLIDHMCSLPEDCNFELDPAKASSQEVARNQETIKVVARGFLDIICTSAPGLPPMIREICTHISKTVAEVWPEAKFAALGAFIFLRFISPTMVSPDSVDIELPRDNGVLRRGLLIITKIIQNLANNIMFGKEVHMMCFNDFLHENIVRITRFLSDVNKYSGLGIEEEPDEWVGGTFDESDAIVLHRFFEKHADKVGKELLSSSKPSKEGEVAAVGGKKAWDSLTTTLVEMGHAAEIPQPNTLPSTEFAGFLEFMARNEDRDVDSVRDLFREIVTSEPTGLFVLTFRKFDVEVLDFELFLFHVFKMLTAANQEERPFEIILDCTGFTSVSEIPIQWFKFCVELIPCDIRGRFQAAHILNADMLVHRYLRKLYNFCAGISFASVIQSYSSVKELRQHVPGEITSYLDYPSGLEQETKEVFRDLTLRQAHLIKIRVNLAVAQSHLRITTVKAQAIFPNLSSKSTQIVSFADVEDVYNVSTGRDANEFIVRRSRNGGTLYFSSPERDHIVKAIRAAKGRVRSQMITTFDGNSRMINVHATLLNIGMTNISHENEDLRNAAYDLLSAVCLSLNDVDSPLVPSKAGLIFGRTSAFVVLLSERLATIAAKLTLDFLTEVCKGLEKKPVAQRINCLQYISPWIKNLPLFLDPMHKLYEHSGAKLRDCVRLLIEFTTRDHEAYSMIQKYIWAEVGKLDSLFVNIVIEEIMRTAVDGGVGSRRCELMADTVAAMSSLNVRGRILSKLRKKLSQTSLKPTKSLSENPHWTEVAVYTRLALVTGYHSRQATMSQRFVPEIIHLVTLLAGIGETLVRVSVYGLAMNLLQSLCPARLDDPSAPEIRALIDEFTQPEALRLFGLVRATRTSEYTSYDAKEDHTSIDALESLSHLLLRAIAICGGSNGLANTWRGRWMTLLATTAFQVSLAIQPRAFIVMGILAPTDVDDDLLYQMLVALKSAMKVSEETDAMCVVSMLRCISNVVAALPENSRYLPQVFWLAVALLQCAHVSFYKEAACLLCASLESLLAQGLLQKKGFNATLLDARFPLEDIAVELDNLLAISFDSNLSFSLAAVLFKGMRRLQLREYAIRALRSLLVTAVATLDSTSVSEGLGVTVHPDVLGYFLALLPVSTTPQSYRQLLCDARIGSEWLPREDAVGRMEDELDQVPRVRFGIMGCTDSTTALLLSSFVGTMLSTAQGDDAESQILYTLLSDAAIAFPNIVSLTYESLQEKIYDTFANSTNPTVLSAVSTVFRIAMEDQSRGTFSKGSSSTLSTLEENQSSSIHGPGRRHLLALDELHMQGIARPLQFMPLTGGNGPRMLKWFPELITRIIE